MVSVKLYVEGGGDAKIQKIACQKGFRLFLERAGVTGRMPRIVACGGRSNAYDRFKTAVGAADGHPVLLVDAEGPLNEATRWGHLRARDGWERPDGATEDQCHVMVQIMESWFLADKPTLAKFYGQGFQKNAFRGNPQVEQVPKSNVVSRLERATRNTQKGTYSKGSHSFEILAALDPEVVEAVAPHAKLFLDTLRAGGPA